MLVELHIPSLELYGPLYYDVLIVIQWFVFMGLILIAISDLTRSTKFRFVTMFIIGITAVTNSYLHLESKRRVTSTFIETIDGNKANYRCHHPGPRGGDNHDCVRQTTTYLHLVRHVRFSGCH